MSFDLRLAPSAVAHLSVLLALLAVIVAASTWLGRYDLLYDHNGVVWGAGYTDVNARIPTYVVEMVIATVAALLAGVTGFGLKLHCAPAGRPPAQASVTALSNDVPTGWTVRLYGPAVWPGKTVWLAVAELTLKSGSTVSVNEVGSGAGAPLVVALSFTV